MLNSVLLYFNVRFWLWGILILDGGSSLIIEANPFICNLLGMTPSDLLGKQLWELGVFQDQQKAEDISAQLCREGYVRYDDLPLVAAAGGRRWPPTRG